MADFSRMDRIEELLMRELAMLVQREISFEQGIFVTLSRVQVSKDLGHAKVWITVFPEEEVKSAIKRLALSANFLRRHLSKRVKLRNIPELRFFYDEALVKANRLTQIMNELDNHKNSDEPSE